MEQWFAEEAEGYADLGAKDRATYRYTYHALNWYHGFRHLPPREFHAVLGLGSAYGDVQGKYVGLRPAPGQTRRLAP